MTPLSLPVEDEPFRPELETQLTEELCKRGLGASIALLPALWVIWEVAGTRAVGRPWVTAVFLAQTVLVVLRLAALVVVRIRGIQGSRVAFLINLALSLGIGLGYGAIVLTTAPALDPLAHAILAVCLIGINAIGVVSMASSPIVYASYSMWNLAALLYRSIVLPVPGFWDIVPFIIGVYIAALAMMIFFFHTSLRAQMLLGLKLREAALRDPLTGLRNRRALHEAMGLEVARIERSRSHPTVRPLERGLMFILVDIDHFKRVNDTYGHASGDAVLAQLAALLTETVRGVDLVARWGGEEFLVVATDVDLTRPFPLPERIRARVEQRLFALPGGKTAHCTCSIGVAAFSPEGGAPAGASWDHTIMDADRALYAAKAAGRNRVVVSTQGLVAGELAPAA